jgi:hypothetical protein
MSYNFVYNIDVLGENIQVREISFIEYRNLVKNIAVNDPIILSQSFEELLSNILITKIKLTLQQKFLILLKYRELIHGKNIEFIVNNTKINYSLDTVYDFFNKNATPYEYKYNQTTYKFLFPTNITTEPNIFFKILDCIDSINNIKTPTILKEDIEKFPALPVVEIYKNLIQHFQTFEFNINHIQYTISLFNDSIPVFLQAIFSYDIEGLYNLEYNLRRHLNFNIQDFNQHSLPECNILLKTYFKELADKESQAVES